MFHSIIKYLLFDYLIKTLLVPIPEYCVNEDCEIVFHDYHNYHGQGKVIVTLI